MGDEEEVGRSNNRDHIYFKIHSHFTRMAWLLFQPKLCWKKIAMKLGNKCWQKGQYKARPCELILSKDYRVTERWE